MISFFFLSLNSSFFLHHLDQQLTIRALKGTVFHNHNSTRADKAMRAMHIISLYKYISHRSTTHVRLSCECSITTHRPLTVLIRTHNLRVISYNADCRKTYFVKKKKKTSWRNISVYSQCCIFSQTL